MTIETEKATAAQDLPHAFELAGAAGSTLLCSCKRTANDKLHQGTINPEAASEAALPFLTEKGI